jgi:hypothetical protein
MEEWWGRGVAGKGLWQGGMEEAPENGKESPHSAHANGLIDWIDESNGNLPLRTCPGCSVPEPYQSLDWVLVPAKPA